MSRNEVRSFIDIAIQNTHDGTSNINLMSPMKSSELQKSIRTKLEDLEIEENVVQY